MSTWREDIILQLVGAHPNMPTDTDTFGLQSVVDAKTSADVVVEGLVAIALVLYSHLVLHGQIELKNLYVVNGVVKLYGWDKAVLVEGKKALDADLSAVKRCINGLLDECKYAQAYRIAVVMPTVEKMATVCDIKYAPKKVPYHTYNLKFSKQKNKIWHKLFPNTRFENKHMVEFLDSLFALNIKNDFVVNQLQYVKDYTIKTPEDMREKLIWRCLGYRPVGYMRLVLPLTSQGKLDVEAAATFLLANHINHGAFILDNFRLIDDRYRLVNFGMSVFGTQDIKQIRELIPEYKHAEPTVVPTRRIYNYDELAKNYKDDMLVIFNLITEYVMWSHIPNENFKRMFDFMCGDNSKRDVAWIKQVYF